MCALHACQAAAALLGRHKLPDEGVRQGQVALRFPNLDKRMGPEQWHVSRVGVGTHMPIPILYRTPHADSRRAHRHRADSQRAVVAICPRNYSHIPRVTVT